jgi:hypothetical protein
MESNIIERIAAHIGSGGVRLPVASEAVVGAAEATLGLGIPKLLRSIYLNVANGGFGPGYGIIGVGGGHRSNLGTLVETFTEIKRGADYLGLRWNPQLLPFCEWGCNVFSCVDCSDPGNPVFSSDECKVHPVNCGLEEFFRMWLDGRDLFSEGGPMRRVVEITNPFTGKKTRVT